MIRFWDTSALAKVYLSTERGHDHARRLAEEPRIPRVRHATSMLAAVELVSAIARRTRSRRIVATVRGALSGFEQCEFLAVHRDVAVRLAVRGKARGADTAIAAQAILFAMAAAEPCEFVTADGQQAALIGASQLAGTASLSVVQLAP